MKLEYLTHDKLSFKTLRTSRFLCDDMSVKQSDKTYHRCTDAELSDGIESFKDHPCYGYLQIHYLKNPFLYVTTPPMKCLFGVQKGGFNQFQMSLQFTDLALNPTMKSFYKFIETQEFELMRHLGLSEDEGGRLITQIKQDKQGKYEPNMIVKLPFAYNKFETDIYSETRSGVNVLSVPSFTMVECDIYLDKVWKMNDKFHAKWKCRCIHIL